MQSSRRTGPSRTSFLLALVVGASLGTSLVRTRAASAAPDDAPTAAHEMLGFSPEHAAAERALESKLDSLVQKQDLREWMKWITAHPHHVGSPHGKEVAEYIARLFKEWGYSTEIETFNILFPTPKTRLVEMIAPEHFTAKLEEPALPQDSTSGLVQEQLPTYNAYSIDGDVTGELIYVNYGTPKDYEALAERGLDVKGKIVLTRYGGCWRGLKPKLAAEHGAIGCLIYSDPHGEGYFDGDTYPNGAWRNTDGVQRGSVADMPVRPGDPLTPGIGATPDAPRLPIKQASTLTKIPVLPLSSADALPLLRALGGQVAPEGWRGALPLTYHLGPGPTRVHLQVECDWSLKPAYDVIGRLAGSERPDEWILRGNHHDAWVFGADDPVSGTVALMEEARVIGALAQSGWKPKRTLIFCAWDAEEPGLMGSTEWVETHADELKQHAVAYINSDSNSRGFLQLGGSHTLEKFMNEVAREVTDPETRVSVAARSRARALAFGNTEERRQIRDHSDLRIHALGSGSDYTPFLQHLGIATIDLGYGGEGEGGSYHSIYDSFDYYTRFIDPDFAYGVALVETSGRTLLRLADADMLPFEPTGFADTVSHYVEELVKLTDEMRSSTAENNRLIRDRTFTLAADPTIPYVPPAPKTPVPYLNFAPLLNACAHVQESARRFEERLAHATAPGTHATTESEVALDNVLMHLEASLIDEDGLPGRPWYKHLIYAPGLTTGYGVKTIPGVREAIEERHWDEVDDQMEAAARALNRFADELSHAQRLVRD